MGEAEQVEIMVSVKDDALRRIREIADELTAQGVKIASVMEGIGAITGSVRNDKIPAIQRVPGVASVERSRDVRVL